MRILVTGAAGQLGSELIKTLSLRGHKVTGTVRGLCSLPVLPDVSYVSLDLTDAGQIRAVLTEARPEAVIHCAAYTAVDDAEENPALCYLINESASETIAKLCGELDAALLYTSTDYVFDGSGSRPWTPKDVPAPLNVYGASKYAGERAVLRFAPKHFIVRISWTYGKNGNNFVKTMLSLGQKTDTVRVVNDQIGSPTYIPDLTVLLAALIESGRYGIYHAASRGFCSRYEFACEIFRLAKLPVTVLPVESSAFPTKALRPKNSRMDTKKLSENGFYELPSWQDGIKRYFLE